MKKLLLLFALMAGAITLTGGSTAHADGPGPFVVTGSDSGRQETGTTAVGVAGGSTGDFAGLACTISGRADNQESVHLDNNLIIRSGSNSVTLFNVEREPGAVTFAGGSLVLGDSISIDRYVGNDDWSDRTGNYNPPIGLFSATVTIALDCESPPPPPPPESSFGAGGQCNAENVFVVTVENTGGVDLIVDVEGGNQLDLKVGESDTTPAADGNGDGNVTVSSGDLVLQVPFLECEPEVQNEPSFTATGACTEDDVFVVTVTNTGNVPLTIDVEGGSQLTLDPGASDSTPADDGGDGNVTVSAVGEELTQNVAFQDCTEPSLRVSSIGPICRADIPYIEYTLDVSGLDPAPTTADITLLDLDRFPIEGGFYPDQPLSGELIWPGASDDPEDWPGWILNEDGFWVVDPTDDHLRDGVILQAEVNPTGEAPVSYPPATAACNSPENATPPPTAPPSTTPPALPKTGQSTSMALIAFALLLFGGGLMRLARRES